MATTEISIKANLTQLRKELALIPGITDKEAKAMSQELIKQLKKSEKAAKKAATGSKKAWQGYSTQVDKTTSAVHNFTEASGDADSTLMGFAGVLDLVNPALGDMARVSGDVLAGAEAVGKTLKFSNPIFLGLAAAAAVLGGAYVMLAGDADTAEESTLDLVAAQRDLQKAMADISLGMLDADMRLMVAQGHMTALEAATTQMVHTVEDEFGDAIDKANIVLEEHRRQLRESENAQHDGVKATTAAVLKEKELREAIVEQEKEIRALGIQQRQKIDKLRTTMALEEDNKKTTKASTKATKEKTEALKEEALAIVDVFEAAQAVAKGDVIGMMQDQLFVKQAELRDKSNALTAQQILEMSQLELQIQTDLLDNKLSVQRAVDEEITKSGEQAADSRVQTAIETANQEIAEAERVAAAKDHAIGLVSGLETQASEWSAKLAEEGNQQNLEAARKAFEIAKAAALSQVAIDTATAVMKISAQAGVLAAPLVVGTLALGASQMAMIGSEQPSFHAGGLIGHGGALNPDERNITARTGEGVVSQAGMARLGADGLDALNRGTGGGGQIIVTQQYQHRAFGAMVQRDIQLPNSPLRKALRGTGRVGHKSRSK